MARGSIQKRFFKKPKNGINYSYSVIYYVNGKPKWETVGSSLKDAQRLLAKRLAEVNSGTYFKPTDVTFQEIVQRWLETKQSRVKPSTYRGYKGDLYYHIMPVFANSLLINIVREKIEQLLIKIRKNRSASTTNNVRLLLQMIFKYAKSLKYIAENPVEEIKPFPLEHKEMDFLNPEEIRRFFQHSQEPFKTLFLAAIMTGMRRGELLGLQWGDIDWNSNTIFVRRSLYWLMNNENFNSDQRWRFIQPKSKRSMRAIVMSPKLKKALEIHRISATISSHDLIFCNSDGNPLDPDNMVKREFHSTLRFAGLRKVRFHDLRHSYCSLLISQGENIKFIQSQLGHASIQTTIDRYGHLLPIDHQRVGSKLDSQIFSETPQKLDFQVHNLKVTV